MESRTELMLKVYGEVVTRKALGIEDTELDEINMKYVKKWSEQCEVEHQSLDIIKKCPFDLLEWAKTYDEVNDTCYYNLLKEVITND